MLNNWNTPRKLAWRADIVLATADGQGTVEIMRRTGMSVKFHAELTRDLHRELTHQRVMFRGSGWGQGMGDLR